MKPGDRLSAEGGEYFSVQKRARPGEGGGGGGARVKKLKKCFVIKKLYSCIL
jgi:hypothetical protein